MILVKLRSKSQRKDGQIAYHICNRSGEETSPKVVQCRLFIKSGGVYASFTCDNLLAIAYAGNGVFFLAWERLLTRKPLIGSPISLKLLKHPKLFVDLRII